MNTTDWVGNSHFSNEWKDFLTKGNLIAWRRRYVLETYGQEALDKLCGHVSDEARSYLVDPQFAFQWKPLGPMVEIDCGIIDVLMGGDPARMVDFGAAIGVGDLNTIYKLVLKIAISPSALINRLPRMFETYLKRPDVGIDFDGSDATRFTVRNFPMPSYLCTYGCTGWFTSGVRLTGKKDARVIHDQCIHRGDEVCSWSFL